MGGVQCSGLPGREIGGCPAADARRTAQSRSQGHGPEALEGNKPIPEVRSQDEGKGPRPLRPDLRSTAVPTECRSNAGDISDRLAHPLGGSLDLAVPEMGMAQRHPRIGMAQQARDHRHRHPVHHRVARVRVPEIVRAHVLEPGLPAHPVPEREVGAARVRRVARRGKHERTLFPAPRFQDPPGLPIQRHRPGSGLGIDEGEDVASHLNGRSRSCGSRSKQEPDDVGPRRAPRQPGDPPAGVARQGGDRPLSTRGQVEGPGRHIPLVFDRPLGTEARVEDGGVGLAAARR